MTYNIVRPPCSLDFRELSKKELQDYFDWFMDAIPLRVDELTSAVRQSPGFEDWHAFNTPESLDDLGEWLATHVETRPRTREELEEMRSGLAFPIDVPTVELTNQTFSLAMDTGMYLSQVFLHNHPSLRWTQALRGKKYVDYGQPVLVEFATGPFNPVRMMVTLAYGVVRRTRNGGRLRELYEIWAEMIR